MLVCTFFHLPLKIMVTHPQGCMKRQSCKNEFVCAFLQSSLHLPCQNIHNNPHWCPAGSSSFPTIYFLVFRTFNFPKFLHMGYRHSCECWLLNFGLKSREFNMQWCIPDLKRLWATQQQGWEFAGEVRHIRQTNKTWQGNYSVTELSAVCNEWLWLNKKSHRGKSICGDSYLWLFPVLKEFKKLHLCTFCQHSSSMTF